MCYCIHDADGICELIGFTTGKTSLGECSYTYSNTEDIKCDKLEEGFHEYEYEYEYENYGSLGGEYSKEEGGEDFDLEVDEDLHPYSSQNNIQKGIETYLDGSKVITEEKYSWKPTKWKKVVKPDSRDPFQDHLPL